MDLEHKYAALEAPTDTGLIKGYASIFGERDRGGDIVVRGAYKKSLKARPAKGVRFLREHDRGRVIGALTELKEDETGLYFEGQLSLKVQDGAETYELIKMGALDSLSIGYRTIGATYPKTPDEAAQFERKLTEIDLLEVSVVAIPMLPSARVAGVKAALDLSELDELQRLANAAHDAATLLAIKQMAAETERRLAAF